MTTLRKLATRTSDDSSRRRDQWLQGALLVMAVGAIEILGMYLVGRHQPDRRAQDALGILLLAAGAGALIFRRHPVAALITTLVTSLGSFLAVAAFFLHRRDVS